MLNNIHLNPFALAGLLIAITCFVLIIILLKYSRTKVHRLWILFNFAVGIWGIGVFFIGTSSTKQAAFVSWNIALTGGILIPVFFFHMVNVFCEQVNRKVLIFAYLQGIIFILLSLFPQTQKNLLKLEYLFNSLYYFRFINPIFYLLTIFWMGFVIWGHYMLFKFYRKTNDSIKRNQILYFFFGMFIGFIGGSMTFLPFHYIDIYPYGNFLIPIYCIIVTYAIIRHHLLDISIVIQKSFIYSVLIALITAAYFIFVFLAEKLFQGMVGYTSLIISVLYAFVIALFFTPVKNKIQRFADKIFLGKDPIQIAHENELLRQEVLRSEKLKTIATFASGMAHEIKNPLTAIKTFAEYLPQKTDDKEFLDKFSKIVGSEINKIDNLVHQLLDFSKPAPLQLKETDIHKLLDDTLEILSNQFIKYNIKVIKDYYTDEHRLKDTDEHRLSSGDNSCLIIKVDPNQMKQVFLNLFLNSIEAMPNGGTLTVSTNLCPSGGNNSVLICVQDTGCGISEKDLPHIFEPFYSTKEKGSGLGLSIVYNIIKEHKGKIKVESKLGVGTRLIIELPIG